MHQKDENYKDFQQNLSMRINKVHSKKTKIKNSDVTTTRKLEINVEKYKLFH